VRLGVDVEHLAALLNQILHDMAPGLAAPLGHFALHNLWDLCVLSDNIAIRNHPRLQTAAPDINHCNRT
jgi:hypothetical protein